ncbi:amino acid ABC transporter [Devosia yakushimensis]|uniref:Amino acid ABC transporter n=1 Tax=Devosia yakushimensis TaxID=470028 RepID=A0ABQ5UIE7_9HYPH|nr:transporter substrate-binding domain-containing protein [Devosia yakushimensis]GLQ10968.1 amino acid ABC transporter [Devosia yakushimensis]
MSFLSLARFGWMQSHPRNDTSPSMGEARRGWGRTLIALFATLLMLPAFAQTLPYHTDPSAREILPSLSPIPAIRFLTTTDFPPFNFRDAGGELIGFNVDLARRICTEVNVACTIQAWPWEQAADALADNQGDALIAGLDMSPENGARFDFSATYLALPGRFVTRSADIATFDPATLTGKTIAVRTGSTHEAFVRRYLPRANVVPFATEVEALAAVKDRAADLFFGDAMRASFWLNENLDCCGFVGDAYFRPALFGEGLAIAVPAGNDAVRHAIDWALVKLKDNGTLDELYLRWFPVGFY